MNDRVFVNPRQPQTLYISQVLLYISAVTAVVFGAAEGVIGSVILRLIVAALLTFGAALGAYGIANSQKWGYQLGIAAAVAPFIVRFEIARRFGLSEFIGWNPIGLMFDVAILGALLHIESRNYQKIYFE